MDDLGEGPDVAMSVEMLLGGGGRDGGVSGDIRRRKKESERDSD